ncbi:phage virion morphogenesis protein [Pseudoalteromonas obscura]|uniref:Phage virion morphogenesis protein n=1 Tax=Pseudoalteromonas obscura TaxID=3048491 RepID=A0ABT7ESG3_9GAMM|nr:phage virion morphogenesis protein [Pseudoalteromonas sp. P94(2023)]MDK2597905.1 phage virion morphogenesis protein [Pseudoalteromonas sp. P94(2023)]
MSLKITASGLDSAQLQLAIVCMPAKKRQRLMWRVANEVRKRARANAKKQQSPDGTPWQARKGKKRGKKMLRQLPQALVISSNPNGARVYFQRAHRGKSKYHTGVIAGTHEAGKNLTISAARHKAGLMRHQARKGLKADSPATPGQAKYIVRLRGMRLLSKAEQAQKKRHKPGTWVRITKQWALDNLTFAQAGVIISALQGEDTQPKKASWQVKLPERSFLGTTAQEQQQIFEQAMQGINYGWQVKKQDMKG